MHVDEILENLNEEQKMAVTAVEGYVKVVAGAGTGKTRVLTSRLCYLIKNGVNPENILSVTFTNKAANEMQERIMKILGYRLENNTCTFHGFCHRFLRSHIILLGYPSQFMIMDTDYQLKVLREIYADKNISSHALPYDEMLEYISRLKNKIEYIPTPGWLGLPLNLHEPRNKVFEHYLFKQREIMALDFDDLLWFVLHILKNHTDLLGYWQERLHYIQVDEAQDINEAQFLLIEILQGKHKNLFVVGDPDQTIYSWRGADINFINDFEKRFPGTQTFLLTTNYRSNSSIVAVCNSLIKNNPNRIDKPLIPEKQEEGKVVHYNARSIYDEANFIAESILALKEDQYVGFEDIAILYRSSYISRPLEEALIQSHIPYMIVKGTAFYDRQEIKDLLALLRLLVYGDDISFLRIINKPARKMGTVRIELLKQYAKNHNVSLLQALTDCVGQQSFNFPAIVHFVMVINEMKSRLEELSVSQALEEILLHTGYENALRYDLKSDRIENVQELKQSIAKSEERAGGKLGIAEFLAEVALYAEAADEELPNSVKLMTVHSAKGLEFKHVFVSGLNEGKFPSSKIASEKEVEEERRIAYVAFTRAQNGLILTSSSGQDYKNIPLRPSRFLSEISPGLIQEIKPANFYIPQT